LKSEEVVLEFSNIITGARKGRTLTQGKSKGEQAIEMLMTQLDPGSERYRILASARRFKSSWVELGEKLLHVQTSAAFRDWGYQSFDEYCAREVRIRRPTAEKLTQAYRFLEREEPELLARSTEIRPLPDFRSVDLLRQARELEGMQDGTYRELYGAVMESGAGHATLARQIRQATAGLQPVSADQTIRLALQAARRLQSTLTAVNEIPAPDKEVIGQVIARLEALLAENPTQSVVE
jgi:hypothetical protein